MGYKRSNMAVGKNKGLKIGGKKGAKKKIVDPFTRKDWYDIKAPSLFKVRQVGKTLVNRTQGTRIASDGLKGRVYEVSLADLQNENDAERSFRKFRLVCEEVQGKNCLTNFHGMGLTTDKLRSMVKKWQTLIEAKPLLPPTLPPARLWRDPRDTSPQCWSLSRYCLDDSQ